MIPLSAASGTLQFSRTSERNYELKLNGEVVGTLSRPSLLSQKFVAESQDGRWIIRRSGFFATEIVDAESEHQIAFCKWNWCDKGQLTFADGERYQVGPEGFWRPIWAVIGENGEVVLQLRRREKTADIPPNTMLPSGRIALLSMFAWYCVLKTQEDAATVAVSAAVS